MISWWLAGGVCAVLFMLLAYQRFRTKARIDELKEKIHDLSGMIARDERQAVAVQRMLPSLPQRAPSLLDQILPKSIAAHDIGAAADYWLVMHLETIQPRLRAKDVSDFEKVCWLRHWVAQRIPDATFECSLDADRRHSVYELPVARILHDLGATNKGFKCAGTALVLQKTCDLFGFRASTYNFGDPLGGRATHMLCLVEIDRGGEKIWSVQDPYFDYALVDEQGRPLSFEETIEQLASGGEHAVVLEASGDARLFLQAQDDRDRIAWLEQSGGVKCAEQPGVVLYRCRQTPADWVARHPEAGRFLEREAGCEDFRLLMLFPLGFSGSPVPEAWNALLEARQAERRKRTHQRVPERV